MPLHVWNAARRTASTQFGHVKSPQIRDSGEFMGNYFAWRNPSTVNQPEFHAILHLSTEKLHHCPVKQEIVPQAGVSQNRALSSYLYSNIGYKLQLSEPRGIQPLVPCNTSLNALGEKGAWMEHGCVCVEMGGSNFPRQAGILFLHLPLPLCTSKLASVQ